WRRRKRDRALSLGGSQMSESLKFGEGGGAGNTSVFGYLEEWDWTKNAVDLLKAYRGKRDFFHVVWQVNTSRRKQRAESARTIFLLVGSPSYEKDLGLNTIKREVIEALVASNIGK